ncbi:MAG: hypothetical protein QM762_07030 [Chryseolinea sp.]
MVPTADYPRWKHVAMQVALWLVLVATVAVAQQVVKRKAAVLRPGMAEAAVELGSFKVRLPEGWENSVIRRGAAAVQINAAEVAVKNSLCRTLTVIWQHLPQSVAPIDVLRSSGLMSPRQGSQPLAVELERYPDYPAIYLETMKVAPCAPGQFVYIKDLMACVTLPNGEVLFAYLNGQGQIDEADKQLIGDLLSLDIDLKQDAPQLPLVRLPTPPPVPAPPGQNPGTSGWGFDGTRPQRGCWRRDGRAHRDRRAHGRDPRGGHRARRDHDAAGSPLPRRPRRDRGSGVRTNPNETTMIGHHKRTSVIASWIFAGCIGAAAAQAQPVGTPAPPPPAAEPLPQLANRPDRDATEILGPAYESAAHGIMLRGPAGSKVLRRAVSADEIVQFVNDAKDWQLKVSIAQLRQPVPLVVTAADAKKGKKGLLALTCDQFLEANPGRRGAPRRHDQRPELRHRHARVPLHAGACAEAADATGRRPRHRRSLLRPDDDQPRRFAPKGRGHRRRPRRARTRPASARRSRRSARSSTPSSCSTAARSRRTRTTASSAPARST